MHFTLSHLVSWVVCMMWWSVVLTSWIFRHSLFPKSKYGRLISLQLSYFVLTNSIRVRSQIRTLGAQLGLPAVVQAYDLMSSKSRFGYLFIDDAGDSRFSTIPNEPRCQHEESYRTRNPRWSWTSLCLCVTDRPTDWHYSACTILLQSLCLLKTTNYCSHINAQYLLCLSLWVILLLNKCGVALSAQPKYTAIPPLQVLTTT